MCSATGITPNAEANIKTLVIPFSFYIVLTLFRMGISGAAHGCVCVCVWWWWRGGGAKKASLPKICHYNGETWHSYTLHKEDPKIYESRGTTPNFC